MITTIRLPDELHKKLKAQAERKGMTFNAYMLGVLWTVCEREGKVETWPGGQNKKY